MIYPKIVGAGQNAQNIVYLRHIRIKAKKRKLKQQLKKLDPRLWASGTVLHDAVLKIRLTSSDRSSSHMPLEL